MSFWQTWVRRPQTHWAREVFFQIHLWTGIGLGLYVVLVCVTGSAVVFNNELFTALQPAPRLVHIVGTRLSRSDLKNAAQKLYPNAIITRVFESRKLDEAAEVGLNQSGKRSQRLFDPYTGADLGNAQPLSFRVLSTLSQLHENLLLGYTGRLLNGVGSLFLVLTCISGAVIWWPGIQRWRAALTVRRGVSFRLFNWDLHSAVGFWTFTIVFIWAVTGAYLVFPRPTEHAIHVIGSLFSLHREQPAPAVLPSGPNAFSDAVFSSESPLALFKDRSLIQSAHSLHVGDFGGWPVKALWVLLGLVPPFLFVTGAIMWWHRVLSPTWARSKAARRARPHPSMAPHEAASAVHTSS